MQVVHFLKNVVLVVSLLVLSSCKVEVVGPDVVRVETPLPEKLLGCTAVLESGASSVDSGAAVNVVVSADGGLGPYTLVGTLGAFEDAKTVSKSFLNDTDAALEITETFLVTDDLGLSEQCALTVTVNAVTDGDDSGDDSGDDNGDDDSGDDSGDDSDDNAGSITIISSPSPSVASNLDITLFAFTLDIGFNPTIAFSHNEPGITMTVNGSSAVFSADDEDASHTFDVTITATEGDKTATTTTTLTFTAVTPDTPLTCTLSHDLAMVGEGETVTFSVDATSGEDVTVTHFDAGTDGTVVSHGDGDVLVRYSSSGQKVVRARASSDASGQECNGGDVMTDSILVGNPLACTASTAFVNYFPFEAVWANATVASDSGAGGARVVDVRAVPDALGEFFLYPTSLPLWSEVYFFETGTFQIQLTVQDNANNTATCTTPSIRVR